MALDRPDFSDYIVFVDESGSPTMSSIDPDYPIFVLVFCIVNKWTYADHIQPAMKRLKFEFFGHDMSVLHSRDIRKPKGEYSFLHDPKLRANFLGRVDRLVADADFELIVHIIDKRALVGTSMSALSPYNTGLALGLARLSLLLDSRDQTGKLVHIIAESRGRKEDMALAEHFNIIVHQDHLFNGSPRFNLKFAEKAINSAGLQLADLTAHPIGRKYLKPEQENHAYNIVEPKISGKIWGFP